MTFMGYVSLSFMMAYVCNLYKNVLVYSVGSLNTKLGGYFEFSFIAKRWVI